MFVNINIPGWNPESKLPAGIICFKFTIMECKFTPIPGDHVSQKNSCRKQNIGENCSQGGLKFALSILSVVTLILVASNVYLHYKMYHVTLNAQQPCRCEPGVSTDLSTVQSRLQGTYPVKVAHIDKRNYRSVSLARLKMMQSLHVTCNFSWIRLLLC